MKEGKFYILQSFIFLLAEFCDLGLFTKSSLKSPYLEGIKLDQTLSNIATTRHKTRQERKAEDKISIELENKNARKGSEVTSSARSSFGIFLTISGG